jgi:hypothetical protein
MVNYKGGNARDLRNFKCSQPRESAQILAGTNADARAVGQSNNQFSHQLAAFSTVVGPGSVTPSMVHQPQPSYFVPEQYTTPHHMAGYPGTVNHDDHASTSVPHQPLPFSSPVNHGTPNAVPVISMATSVPSIGSLNLNTGASDWSN